jgi:hypothetical protein
MDPTQAHEVDMDVVATDVENLLMEERILVTVGAIQAMDGVIQGTPLIGKVSAAKTDLLRSECITIAQALPTLGHNASTLFRSIWLVERRSFQGANWQPPA